MKLEVIVGLPAGAQYEPESLGRGMEGGLVTKKDADVVMLG